MAQEAPFRVGTAIAARGRVGRGAIEVPAGSDADLTIPVAVVHGARPGPVLAGSHGTEYASNRQHRPPGPLNWPPGASV